MRLLSLYKNLISATNSTAQFDNNIEDDLNIEPYSKLALISANISYTDSFIEINQFNNQFKLFVTQGSIDRDEFDLITLQNGKYTSSQWLEELQEALNSGIVAETPQKTENGLSTNVFYNDKKQLSIQFGRGTNTLMTPTPHDAATLSVSTANKSVSRVDTAQNFNGYAQMTQTPINKGPGRHKFKLGQVSGTQKFVLGIINDKIDLTTKTSLEAADYTVFITNDNSGNFLQVNGVVTNQAATNNFEIDISINGGKVQFLNAANGNVIAQQTIEYRENLGKKNNFIYCSLKGKDTLINFTNFIPDPLFVPTSADNLGINPSQTVLQLQFNSPLNQSLLFKTLGFGSPILKLQSAQSLFIAIQPLNFEAAEDSGVNVVMENLRLGSFNFSDSVQKAQAILHHIPEGLRDENGILSYIAGNMINISLNNQFPLNVRNLRISIRNSKDNSIISADEVALCVVVLDEKE